MLFVPSVVTCCQVMQNMMPVIRETVAQAASSTTEAEADCPLACVEEDIATDISFTLVSEESRALNKPSRSSHSARRRH